MKIAYITNASENTGVGSRAFAVRRELEAFVLTEHLSFEDVRLDERAAHLHPWPGVLGSKSIGWIRAGRVFSKKSKADVFDLTNQSLSFMARRVAPAVVTVHDLIEITNPQDKRAKWVNQYLYSGIERADHLIAVSEYTKKMLRSHYDMRDSDITVIHNGVGDDFYPIESFSQSIGYQELRQSLKLGDSYPIILYVGSDHPRKNIPIALEVFAKFAQKHTDSVFIKVGRPGIAAGREETESAIDRLRLKDKVRFMGDVSQEKLNELYNLADVLLFPSRLEGFGLPPLQAMAAGLPVVTSNATSIPEVVGDAAITASPDDVGALLRGVERLVEEKEAKAEYRRRGLMRAKKFSWPKATLELLKTYAKVSKK